LRISISDDMQMQAVVDAVERENELRNEDGTDHDASDNNFQSKFDKYFPGRRLTATLVSEDSKLTFSAVILDSTERNNLQYPCAVFLVPKVIAMKP
jgi:hypothetical protein